MNWRDTTRLTAADAFITLGLLIAGGVVLVIGVALVGYLLR
jgi:hypothetical protein